jgi:hypothetical protein
MTNVAATVPSKRRRWRRALIALALVAAGALLAMQGAAWYLQRELVAALGENSEVGGVRLGWGEVVVERVRIRGPEGWPVEDALRAGRVFMSPDLRSLFGERFVIRKIVFENAYLSLLRERDGKLRLLPSLLERKPDPDREDKPSRRAMTIGRVELDNAALDLYDRSVRSKETVNLRLDEVKGGLDELRIPELDERSDIELHALVRGEPQDGEASLRGWLQIASRNSELDIRIRDVDLVALSPYLIRESDPGVERGRVALDLKSTVRDRKLEAPGELVLSDLKLKSGEGVFGSFMGVPRQAVIAALKSGRDELRLNFKLQGDLDSPAFSLNETLAVRVAVGMAAALGVGLVDFVKGVGTLSGEGLRATGDAILELFGVEDDEDEAPEGGTP